MVQIGVQEWYGWVHLWGVGRTVWGGRGLEGGMGGLGVVGL